VSRLPQRKPFADVVQEIRDQPAPRAPEFGGVVDPSGVRWVPSKPSISATEAHGLAQAGAAVAWDPCGCGGHCGFTWFSVSEVARLVAAGTPTVRNTKRHQGNLSLWLSGQDRVLVVAEDAVRWGDLLE